jgi:hypothetical protein
MPPAIPELGLARAPLRAYQDPVRCRRQNRMRTCDHGRDRHNEKPQAAELCIGARHARAAH